LFSIVILLFLILIVHLFGKSFVNRWIFLVIYSPVYGTVRSVPITIPTAGLAWSLSIYGKAAATIERIIAYACYAIRDYY